MALEAPAPSFTLDSALKEGAGASRALQKGFGYLDTKTDPSKDSSPLKSGGHWVGFCAFWKLLVDGLHSCIAR